MLNDWMGVGTITVTIGLGLIILTIAASYIEIFQKKNAAYIWVGVMSGIQILVSFTSAKECGIILGGKEYFIIAGSLIYPVLSCGEDLINEYYGKGIAKNALHGQIISRIITTVYLLYIIYLPAPSNAQDNYIQFYNLMKTLPRVAISSIAATYIAGYINVSLYARIKKMTDNRFLWLRSIISTISSSFFNALLFSLFAFLGIKELNSIFQMIIVSVIVRAFTGVLEIPFLYGIRLIFGFISKNNR